VKLLLKEKLDRESESEYRMQLFAVDGGADAMTGTAMVTVYVINDVISDVCRVCLHGNGVRHGRQ